MDDEIFLPWTEVARALSHYVYARYHWPADAKFELIDGENGLLLKLLGENPKTEQDFT